jgi:cobalt-zinc-cadmium efflux system protein
MGNHAHDHEHAPRDHGRAFALGVGINFAFVIVEVVFGVVAHSVALLADAAHNFGDVLGLALGWGAVVLARRKPSRRRTYGFRKSTILAAVANAVLLLAAVGGVAREALGRLREPPPVDGRLVVLAAAVGVVVNGASAMLFAKGRKKDVNVKGAFLHLATDAAVSLGVVVGGLVMLWTGWEIVDPLVTFVVSAAVLYATWSLLRRSLDLALDAVPEGIDAEAVHAYLAALPGVCDVHDLHIWAMSTTETALTAHLVLVDGNGGATFLADVSRTLHEKFQIEHATVQIEHAEAGDPCRLASGDGV